MQNPDGYAYEDTSSPHRSPTTDVFPGSNSTPMEGNPWVPSLESASGGSSSRSDSRTIRQPPDTSKVYYPSSMFSPGNFQPRRRESINKLFDNLDISGEVLDENKDMDKDKNNKEDV